MTKQEITVFITKMHPVTLAITEEGTIATSIFFHPIAVTEWLEAFFPYLHKIVPIDIPLMKITPDTGTSRDRTVYQDRTDSNTGITSKEAIAYFSFVLAEKAFAAITQMYLSLLTDFFNEVHKSGKFFICQLELRMRSSTANRKDSKHPPLANAYFIKRCF